MMPKTVTLSNKVLMFILSEFGCLENKCCQQILKKNKHETELILKSLSMFLLYHIYFLSEKFVILNYIR